METMLAFLEKIGNYLMLVRLTDILDVAIIAFLVYKLLDLVKSTRAENILKGVVMFLLALWLAEIFPLHMRGLGIGIAVFFGWTTNAFLALFFPSLVEGIGITGAFFMFAVVGAITLLGGGALAFDPWAALVVAEPTATVEAPDAPKAPNPDHARGLAGMERTVERQ